GRPPTKTGCGADPEAEPKDGKEANEIHFLKKSVAAFQGATPASRRQWRRQLYQQIREAVEAAAAVNGLCLAAGVSRAGYYRFRRRAQPQEAGMNLRNQIQRIALRWPAYGYRRVHAELLRQG